MSILGTRVLRTEDPRLLTHGGTYLDDVDVPGAAHLVYVRSPFAHARITATGTEAAKAAPGVVAVLTAADLDIAPAAPGFGSHPSMVRSHLARDVVRFTGEAVAMVIAETRAQAVDAAELVTVDYDPLPAVVDPEAAASEGATLLYAEAGSNVIAEFSVGDVEAELAACDVVVEQRLVNQRISASPLETRGAAASWSEDGRLTFWVSTQGAHPVRN